MNIFLVGMMLTGVFIGWTYDQVLDPIQKKFYEDNNLEPKKSTLKTYAYILCCGIPILGLMLIFILKNKKKSHRV